MFLDSWTTGTISVQCAVSGTINYTVQSTLDNPADPHNSVSSVNVNWFDSNDSAVVGAISSQQSNFQYAPAYVRVIKNTGTGSVNTTLLQTGVTNL